MQKSVFVFEKNPFFKRKTFMHIYSAQNILDAYFLNNAWKKKELDSNGFYRWTALKIPKMTIRMSFYLEVLEWIKNDFFQKFKIISKNRNYLFISKSPNYFQTDLFVAKFASYPTVKTF